MVSSSFSKLGSWSCFKHAYSHRCLNPIVVMIWGLFEPARIEPGLSHRLHHHRNLFDRLPGGAAGWTDGWKPGVNRVVEVKQFLLSQWPTIIMEAEIVEIVSPIIMGVEIYPYAKSWLKQSFQGTFIANPISFSKWPTFKPFRDYIFRYIYIVGRKKPFKRLVFHSPKWLSKYSWKAEVVDTAIRSARSYVPRGTKVAKGNTFNLNFLGIITYFTQILKGGYNRTIIFPWLFFGFQRFFSENSIPIRKMSLEAEELWIHWKNMPPRKRTAGTQTLVVCI